MGGNHDSTLPLSSRLTGSAIGKGDPSLRDGIESRVNLPSVVAFLDHDLPDLATAAEISQKKEGALVAPMLLSTAFHARFDLPKAMAQAGLTRALPPIGHPLELLTSLIQAAGSHVVVVAAGTTDQGARQIFKEAVEVAAVRSGSQAAHAFITGPGPHLYDQLVAAEDSGLGDYDFERAEPILNLVNATITSPSCQH